jgi:hypothetical protein
MLRLGGPSCYFSFFKTEREAGWGIQYRNHGQASIEMGPKVNQEIIDFKSLECFKDKQLRKKAHNKNRLAFKLLDLYLHGKRKRRGD